MKELTDAAKGLLLPIVKICARSECCECPLYNRVKGHCVFDFGGPWYWQEFSEEFEQERRKRESENAIVTQRDIQLALLRARTALEDSADLCQKLIDKYDRITGNKGGQRE